jgi:RNA polymerase sigma factor (sigma-70 family)
LAVRFRILANHKIWNDQDAEDVIQNALAVVVREYKAIDITVSFAAWAYKVLDNKVLSYIKAKAQRVEVSDDDPPGRSGAEPLLKIRLKDCVQKVRRANARYGQAVVLHCHGYTTEEVCAKLEVTTQNFYMILSRARALLKRCLETGEIT